MDSDPRPIGASVAGKRAHSYPAEWTLHEELTTTNSHEWRSWGMKQMILGVCGMKEKVWRSPYELKCVYNRAFTRDLSICSYGVITGRTRLYGWPI